MPTPSPEAEIKSLKRQLAELAGQVAETADRLSEHAYQSPGQEWAGGFVPHPIQRASVLEFGAGDFRLDETGIQFRVPLVNFLENAAFWFLPEFAPTSLAAQDLYPKAKIYPTIDGTSATLLIQSDGDSSNRASLSITGDSGATGATIILTVKDTSLASGEGTVTLISNGSNNYAFAFSDDEWILGIPVWASADPGGFPNDGSIWYRADTDKVRVRVNGSTENLALESFVTGAGSTLTIATGAVTATGRWHLIDTEAAAATDDLDTISGTTAGQIYVFQAVNSARDVVFKDGTGNLKMAGDFTADNVEDTITFISNGTNLYELARSGNGA